MFQVELVLEIFMAVMLIDDVVNWATEDLFAVPN